MARILFAIGVFGALASSPSDDSDPENGSDADYLVTDLHLQEGELLHYVDVVGIIRANRTPLGFGPTADIRFYDDGWNTIIVNTSATLGSALEEEGDEQLIEEGHYQVWLLPASGGFDRVCAEIRVEDSNIPDWTEVGCIRASSE